MDLGISHDMFLFQPSIIFWARSTISQITIIPATFTKLSTDNNGQVTRQFSAVMVEATWRTTLVMITIWGGRPHTERATIITTKRHPDQPDTFSRFGEAMTRLLWIRTSIGWAKGGGGAGPVPLVDVIG